MGSDKWYHSRYDIMDEKQYHPDFNMIEKHSLGYRIVVFINAKVQKKFDQTNKTQKNTLSLHQIFTTTIMKVTIYEHAEELPELTQGSYFHSRQLMEACQRTPGHKAYMAVVSDADGRAIAHLLAVERRRKSWLPPFFYSQVRVLGEGVYTGGLVDGTLFGMMVDSLTKRLSSRVLFIEISHLSQKMFGYRQLRQSGYFPVRWMSIHNSLHSRPPEERITSRMLHRVENAIKRGVTTRVVNSEEDFTAAMKLLRRHLHFKPRRYMPQQEIFREMTRQGVCRIFITHYHQHVIGCTVVVYSDGDAYLWYSASRRKTFATLHPNAVTFWNTIRAVYQEGCQHIRFIDVGLPFRRNPYRDFILRFGGKEVSGYRWFRISIGWVNKIASWLWRQ